MRYRGQERSVAIDFKCSASIGELLETFNAAHAKAFSFDLSGSAVEFTAVHLHAEAQTDVINVARLISESLSPAEAVKGHRRVYLGDEGWVECKVDDRARLRPKTEFAGPALIEEATTTTLVLTGQKFYLDPFGQLVILPG